MKKTIAMISALAMAVCSLTACGKDKESSKVSDKELIKAYEEMQEAVKNGEKSDYLKCMFPDNVAEGMEKSGLSELMGGNMGDMSEDADFEIKEVVKTEDIPEEDIENMEKVYSLFDEVVTIFDEEGIDVSSLMSGEVDEEKMEEIGEKLSYVKDAEAIEELDIDVTVQIQDAKKVTFAVEKDGEKAEEEIPMYKVKGEGWKIEVMYIALMDYADKAKAASANSNASSILKAFMSSVVDQDVKGVYTKGVYVFSSDSGKEVLEDESDDSLGGNKEEVYENAEQYFESLNDYEYFAVCVNGSCVYAAVERDGVVGVCPSGQIISEFDGKSYEFEEFDPEGADLDEVYDKCMDALE